MIMKSANGLSAAIALLVCVSAQHALAAKPELEILVIFDDTSAREDLRRSWGVSAVVDSASNETSDCHAAVVVWGAKYADFFVETCLPSLLAEGNLPFLASRMRLLFTIHADTIGRASGRERV